MNYNTNKFWVKQQSYNPSFNKVAQERSWLKKVWDVGKGVADDALTSLQQGNPYDIAVGLNPDRVQDRWNKGKADKLSPTNYSTTSPMSSEELSEKYKDWGDNSAWQRPQPTGPSRVEQKPEQAEVPEDFNAIFNSNNTVTWWNKALNPEGNTTTLQEFSKALYDSVRRAEQIHSQTIPYIWDKQSIKSVNRREYINRLIQLHRRVKDMIARSSNASS